MPILVATGLRECLLNFLLQEKFSNITIEGPDEVRTVEDDLLINGSQ